MAEPFYTFTFLSVTDKGCNFSTLCHQHLVFSISFFILLIWFYQPTNWAATRLWKTQLPLDKYQFIVLHKNHSSQYRYDTPSRWHKKTPQKDEWLVNRTVPETWMKWTTACPEQTSMHCTSLKAHLSLITILEGLCNRSLDRKMET